MPCDQGELSRRKTLWGLLALALLVHLLLSGWAFAFGRINEDEGWYLLAARRVAAGALPYRDFPFSQPPLLPFLHALWHGATHRWNGNLLWWGRLLGLLLATGSVALAALLSKRLGGLRAAVTTAFLLGLNLDQIYFSLLVKTYAAANLFLLLGFLFETRGRRLLAAVGWALAAGTRISLLPLPLLALWRRRNGAGAFFAAAFLLLLLPILLPGRSRFLFWVFHFHLAYDPGGVSGYLSEKARLIGYLAENYGPFLVAFLLLLLPLPPDGGRRGRWPHLLGEAPRRIGIPAVGLFLLHFALRRSLAEYQTVVAPLAAVAIGAAFGALPPRPFGRRFLLLFAFTLLSIPAQFHTTYARDGGSEGVFARTLRVSRLLAALPGGEVFTLHPLYPLLAGKEVVPGAEMGIFSYAPDLDERTSDARMMLTNRKIIGILSARHPLVLLSEGDLTASYPSGRRLPLSFRSEILAYLERDYEVCATIAHTGQFGETITIYRPRKDAQASVKSF